MSKAAKPSFIDSSKVSIKKVLLDLDYNPTTLNPIFSTDISDSFTAIHIDENTLIIYDLTLNFSWNDMEAWIKTSVKDFDKKSTIIFALYSSDSFDIKRISNFEQKTIKVFNIQKDLQMNDSMVDRSLLVMKEMLTDRKYKSDLNVLFQTPISSVKYSSIKIDEPDRETVIIYDMNEKFNWKNLYQWISSNTDFDEENTKLVIFVLNSTISASSKKIKFENSECSIQVFELSELQMNISRHMLQPKMELITDKEAINEVLTKYSMGDTKLKLGNFPQILRDDAMAKYYHAKQGNMFKIYRVSPTSGINIVYRIVV